MIDSIHISNTATFRAPQQLDGLSQFNFFYGSNATGKTSISRIIAEEGKYAGCAVSWRNGLKLQPLVYNQDFISKNFEDLKGIFTLGEKSVETRQKISLLAIELDQIKEAIRQLTEALQGADGLGGKKGALVEAEAELREKCWKQKQKHDPKLSGAFEGYRNSAANFKDKVLRELSSNSAPVKPLAELEKKAETVFGSAQAEEPILSVPTSAELLALEADPILSKRVIGKNDVDIAALIQRLNNSDWVREGLTYFKMLDGQCPFCQQPTTESLAGSLKEYFDEAFEKDTRAINRLVKDYKEYSERLQIHLDEILKATPKFLNSTDFNSNKEVLDARIALNIQRIAEKRKEPSRSVELESLTDSLVNLEQLIENANTQASSHNDTLANLARERRQLTAEVWKYLLEVELKDDLLAYSAKVDALNKVVSSISEKIASAEKRKKETEAKIRELEKTTTSIQPTVDAINAILKSFNFLGFSLATAKDGRSYRLIRPDGSDAKDTLSEGERTFVTFLYFYHLLRGSESETGTTSSRVVVFDDPVSSLDSDVLFVVSSLVRGIFDEIRSGKGQIKQVFVLTHNVYFHKEVTFNPRRRDIALKEETFWIVRKQGVESVVERKTTNPVKTVYEMLWDDVRHPERSKHTIQNAMRRILENYFKILGQQDPLEICEKFDGDDKLVSRSLLSWVNDGSHSAFDDLYISVDDSVIQANLRVFKAIFEKSNQLRHYEMMMQEPGTPPIASVPTTPLASSTHAAN